MLALGGHATRKEEKGDLTWTNTGGTRPGRGQHNIGSLEGDMPRPMPNHGTLGLSSDGDYVGRTKPALVPK